LGLDFDVPNDRFREAGVLDLGDVVGRIDVKRATAKDAV
jgi:hypothetical protein